MTLVKLLVDAGHWSAGSVVELNDRHAQRFIVQGYALPVVRKSDRPRKAEKKEKVH